MFVAGLLAPGAQYDLKSDAAMITAAAGIHFGDHGAEGRLGSRGWLETVPGDDQIRQETHPLAGKLLGRKIHVSDYALAVDGAQAAERLTHQIRVSGQARTAPLEHPLSFAAGKIKPDVAVVIGSERESGSMRPITAGSKLAIDDRISDVLRDQRCDFALQPRWNVLAEQAHHAALTRRVPGGKEAGFQFAEFCIHPIHYRGHKVFLREIRAHAMQRKNDHGGFCEVDRGEDTAEGVVQGEVYVEQSARGNARFAVGAVGPEDVSAAMGFAEYRDEEIPWA